MNLTKPQLEAIAKKISVDVRTIRRWQHSVCRKSLWQPRSRQYRKPPSGDFALT
jgi:hypothetical protein